MFARQYARAGSLVLEYVGEIFAQLPQSQEPRHASMQFVPQLPLTNSA